MLLRYRRAARWRENQQRLFAVCSVLLLLLILLGMVLLFKPLIVWAAGIGGHDDDNQRDAQ